ncbi:DUF4974 domain-containing protein [Glycocaulis profundi]|nr:DUF4974 domain-containing protein [Glycocaulis profundi]
MIRLGSFPPVEACLSDRAAAWFARLRAPDADSTDQAAYARWRLADSSHARVSSEIETLWTLAGELENDPEISALADLAARPSRERPRPAMAQWAAGIAVAAGLAAAAAAFFALDPHAPPEQLASSIHETATGERRRIALADGSAVQLDTDSIIRVEIGENRRGVELLSGRARFTVAPDPDRPFTVAAGAAGVTALGTVFDVRLEETAVAVSLYEGAVDVRNGGPRLGDRALRLGPGQRTRVGGGSALLEAEEFDRATEWGWTEGRLVFSGEPLTEVVAEINRYSHTKIVLTDTEVAANRFRGEFDVDDLDTVLTALSVLYDLAPSRTASGEIVLSPSPQPDAN